MFQVVHTKRTMNSPLINTSPKQRFAAVRQCE